jgi:hypothetical protein
MAMIGARVEDAAQQRLVTMINTTTIGHHHFRTSLLVEQRLEMWIVDLRYCTRLHHAFNAHRPASLKERLTYTDSMDPLETVWLTGMV